MRVLAITNLFPNNVDPGFAPFNRQQFSELAKLVELDVFAMIPWRFGAGSSSRIARREQIDGMAVEHPRFLSIPGVPSLNALFYASALLPVLALRRRRWDVILAAYAYPDGCAGVALGRALGLPVVVKCHGSDLNRVPNDRPARAQISALLPRAAAVVVVSKKLGERAIELGVPASKISVVYNGVDRARFRAGERVEARRRLGLPVERKLVLYVGHLAEHKGTRDLLTAMRSLEERASVVFVGDGPLRNEVREAAERWPERVLAIGSVPHAEVADFMSAADVLCLPSWDEGMPNVVREAHAAGRPVVATAVGGVPEAVSVPVLGSLVPARDPPALAAAISRVLSEPARDAEEIVRSAIVPSWQESAEALFRVLEGVTGRSTAR